LCCFPQARSITPALQGTFRIDFHNGAYSDDDLVDIFIQRLVTPFDIYKNVFIRAGEYHWDRHQFTYGSSQSRRLMMNLFERFGTYYNGHLNEARVRATYRANERLSFTFSEERDRFRLPVPAGNFSVLGGGFQTNYSFSRFLTLSAPIQMDTANTQDAGANIRLRWNYRPDNDLYIVYTSGQRFASLVAAMRSCRIDSRILQPRPASCRVHPTVVKSFPTGVVPCPEVLELGVTTIGASSATVPVGWLFQNYSGLEVGFEEISFKPVSG